MATDYDAPRRGDVDELNEDSIEELKARRAEAQSGSIDVDETELAESLELPGADLSSMSGEELTVRVLPKQSDEFTCSSGNPDVTISYRAWGEKKDDHQVVISSRPGKDGAAFKGTARVRWMITDITGRQYGYQLDVVFE